MKKKFTNFFDNFWKIYKKSQIQIKPAECFFIL